MYKLEDIKGAKWRKEFFGKIDWTGSQISEAEIFGVEAVLVENHDIFATNGKGFKMKKEFKVKLAPRDDRKPIHRKENKIVEMALIHKYGWTKTAKPKRTPHRTENCHGNWSVCESTSIRLVWFFCWSQGCVV